MIRHLFASAALAMAVPAIAAADTAKQTAAEIGPVVGTQAPDFQAMTSGTVAVDLAAISGEQGAALVFSRSLDWCPYCKRQALDLDEIAGELADAGWQLNIITYDEPSLLADFKANKSLNYTLLSDTDSAMIDAFALRNTGVPEGSRFDGIPHPAIVFVSAQGKVRAYLREEGYEDRPAKEIVMQTAQLLNEATLDE